MKFHAILKIQRLLVKSNLEISEISGFYEIPVNKTQNLVNLFIKTTQFSANIKLCLMHWSNKLKSWKR